MSQLRVSAFTTAVKRGNGRILGAGSRRSLLTRACRVSADGSAPPGGAGGVAQDEPAPGKGGGRDLLAVCPSWTGDGVAHESSAPASLSLLLHRFESGLVFRAALDARNR